MVRLVLSDELLRELEGDTSPLFEENAGNEENWTITLEVFFFHSIDDIFLDGQLLKKMLIRGVSTAKP